MKIKTLLYITTLSLLAIFLTEYFCRFYDVEHRPTYFMRKIVEICSNILQEMVCSLRRVNLYIMYTICSIMNDKLCMLRALRWWGMLNKSCYN